MPPASVSLKKKLFSRLATLDAFAEGLEVADRASGGRFAGAWVEHSPKLRLVIRLTGTRPLPDRATEALAAIRGPVEIELGANHSLQELRLAQDKVAPIIHTSYPDMGFGLDLRTGEIELRGPTWLAPADIEALSAAAGVPVRVTETPALEHGHT